MRAFSMAMAVMLVFSSTVWAAGPLFTGHMRARGVVLTNSVSVPDGGTVRSGDTITTAPGGLALITSPAQGRLEVRSDSEARLGVNRVQLHRGAVAAGRIAVEAGGYTFQPQSVGESWFAVAYRDGRFLIAAHRGNILIADASGALPVVVPEGSFAQQSDDQQTSENPPSGQPKQESKGKKKKRAAAGAAAGGWTIGGLSHAASVALVVGVGAGVAAVSVGAAIALSEENPSPSQ